MRIPEDCKVNSTLERLKLIYSGFENCLPSMESDDQSAPFGIFPDGFLYVKNLLD